MIHKILAFFSNNRYKVAVFALMTAASGVCILLVMARIEYSDERRYTGLVWNLFLAWIPFVLSYMAYALSWRKMLLYAAIPLMAILWLVFFPNAPYILTDLQHLARESNNAPLWYDVIMLVWFSWTGLLLGLISLYFMHEIVQRAFGRAAGWAFILIVSGLGSFGVYLGRFVRLNSWDILQDTRELAVSVLGLVIDPSLRLLAFTSLFTVFYLFVYLTLYSLGHLLQEKAGGR
jgi:uncharacterized membrane protein